jgi:HEAT repeat protein
MRTRPLNFLPTCLVTALVLSGPGCGSKKPDYSVSGQMENLKHEDPDLRSTAATVLGNYGVEAKEAVPGLIELLKDPDKHVRRSAVYALARFGRDATDALPALKEALKDPDLKVREGAAYAIKEIQNPTPKPKSEKKKGK